MALPVILAELAVTLLVTVILLADKLPVILAAPFDIKLPPVILADACNVLAPIIPELA